MREWEQLNDYGCEMLVSAIIEKAVDDYIFALKLLHKNEDSEPGKIAIRQIRKFFRSEYFVTLCNLDGEALIMATERQFYENHKKKQTLHKGGRKSRPIKGTHMKTGEIVTFESASEASRLLSCDRNSILNALAGRSEYSQDRYWEYLDL